MRPNIRSKFLPLLTFEAVRREQRLALGTVARTPNRRDGGGILRTTAALRLHSINSAHVGQPDSVGVRLPLLNTLSHAGVLVRGKAQRSHLMGAFG